MAKSTIEIKADTTELNSYIDQLVANLANAPQEVRQLALRFVDIPSELIRFECGAASGAGVTVLLKPSQRLLDLGTAIRTGNFDLFVIKNAHDY